MVRSPILGPQLQGELVASLELPLGLQQGFREVDLVLNTITDVAGGQFEQVKIVWCVVVGTDRVDVPGHRHVDLTGVDGRGSSLENVDPGDGVVNGSIDG